MSAPPSPSLISRRKPCGRRQALQAVLKAYNFPCSSRRLKPPIFKPPSMPQAAQASVDALKLSLLLPPASFSSLPVFVLSHRMPVSVSASLAWFPFLSPSPLSPAATRRRVRRSSACHPSSSRPHLMSSRQTAAPTTALRASPPAMALHPLTRVAFSGSFMCQVALRR
ncbi:hypothetical protein C8F01DRAFT_1374697 [Mycena amicta]|nr:hypothetical protein C8F01DRAFT_1378155 [Mycena amicta]KAJ7054250.1 hypothetical protein C8F01DRAFT_1374697 [Mycena amicta]